MEQISYKLEVFEGPMDLLLHLISKHKLNIYDIPIALLVEQYIDYVKQMQNEDMYVASEFLEMAARLVYIKTVSLLPVYDEIDDLKKELTGELLEYRDCQLMAGKLSLQTDGFNHFVREPIEFDVDNTYTRFHDTSEILKAYLNAAGRKLRNLPVPIEAFKGIISTKIVSVGSKIKFIFKRLSATGKKQDFNSLFSESSSRSDMVATFLAVLELAKVKKVKLYGDGDETQIELIASDFNEMSSEEWE
ncbi:MAG: segregation/condensation protein A [Oscillospiraceae bacterium]